MDNRLVLARFLYALALLVLVLPVVHDAAHRRRRIRRYFHQVQPPLRCVSQRVLRGHDPQLISLFIDDAHLSGNDLFIDPHALFNRLGDNPNLLLAVNPVQSPATGHGSRADTKKSRQRTHLLSAANTVLWRFLTLHPGPKGRGRVRSRCFYLLYNMAKSTRRRNVCQMRAATANSSLAVPVWQTSSPGGPSIRLQSDFAPAVFV